MPEEQKGGQCGRELRGPEVREMRGEVMQGLLGHGKNCGFYLEKMGRPRNTTG